MEAIKSESGPEHVKDLNRHQEIQGEGKKDGGRNPIICVIGGTGSGKSTFCHLLTGSDPRTN